MRIAEAFAEAYALAGTAASLVFGMGLVIVPRVRTRFEAWRGNRRLAAFLAEAAAYPEAR
jgi:hypothetical protein